MLAIMIIIQLLISIQPIILLVSLSIIAYHLSQAVKQRKNLMRDCLKSINSKNISQSQYLKQNFLSIDMIDIDQITMESAQNTNTALHSTLQLPSPPSPQQQVPFSQLFRYSDCTDYLMIIVGVFCSCAMGAAFPVFGFLTGSMIDSFDNRSTLLQQASRNLFLYIGLGAAAMVLGAIMFSTWTILGERQAIKCRQQYFRSLMKQQIAWFDVNDQALIADKFETDTQIFQSAVGQKISSLLLVVSMLVVGIGLSLYIGWILTLVVLAYIPIVIAIWTKDISTRLEADQTQDSIYRESDFKIQETVSSIKLVKQMNGEEFQCSIQDKLLTQVKDMYSTTMLKFILFCALAALALDLLFPLVFWYGSECVFNSSLCPQSISTQPYTAGSIVKILYGLLIPAISLNQLTPCLQKIKQGKQAAARIFIMIDRVPIIKSKHDSIVPNEFRGVIQFRNVSFAYPKNRDKKILSGLNFVVDVRHSAIIGTSGGGKSTIFQLIMRFYDPDEGTIFLNNLDLRQLNLEWLRSQIGYINQEPVLFATSIRQNLLLAKPQSSEEELEEALRKAEALDFVSSLRDRLDTFVGSGGSQLSGGQKQRIAIARILLKECRLVLMDEATSALDRRSESMLLQTLRSLQSDFMLISITHRKKVLSDCEKVYKLMDESNIKTISTRGSSKREGLLRTNVSHESSQLPKTSVVQQSSKQERLIEKKDNGKAVDAEGQLINPDKGGNSDSDLQRVFKYITKQKCRLVVGSIACIAHGLCFPFFGIVIARIIKEQIQFLNTGNPSSKNTTRMWYLIALGVAFLDPLFSVIGKLSFGLIAKDAIARIRMEAYRNVVYMPVGWFQRKQNSPQKISSEITNSCKNIFNFIKLFVPHLLIIIVNILFSLIGALVFEWRTGLTSFGLIPLIVISQGVQLSFVLGLTESKNKIYGESIQTIKESVMNIRTVLSLGAESALLGKYNRQLGGVIDSIKVKAVFSGIMYGLATFMQFVSFALIFFLSAVYIDRFNLEISGPLQAIFLILYAGITAGNNSSYLTEISKAKAATKNIFAMIDLQNQVVLRQKSGSKNIKTPIRGNIRFEDVDFQYENREEVVLRDFNLEIKSQENIAIVGRSGCGKSTLFGLLLGLYQPKKGRILVEGIDINDYDLQHLRQSFGVVSQEPVLFNETAAWNIRYNKTEASEEEIQWAARKANYIIDRSLFEQSQEINNLTVKSLVTKKIPDSSRQLLQKNVGPKGSHVSGGQKQRIAIARAILRSPSVLLLDEATSALDPQNQAIVQKTLEGLMEGNTTLNITHRLEQVEDLKRVVVLREGKVEQDGSFRELRTKENGYFQVMLNVPGIRKLD